jgi:hypothetical protein
MKFMMNESCEKLKKETEIGETYMKLRRNWVFQRWKFGEKWKIWVGGELQESALCVLKF